MPSTPPDFNQFCHEIVNISPLAYHTFRSILGGRSASDFRVMRGRERRFPLAIDDSLFETVVNYFSSINYTGPVCLACDDTKLIPALKTYYDASTKQWYLLGGATGAIAIASTDELTSILKEGNIPKASKNSGYSPSRYFISQQASNILTTVIEGLILLIYAYRDYMPEGTPLLPWLHSSESCKHFFGEMRKLVPDFTYPDFIFSVPKLRVLLRASYRQNPEFTTPLTEHKKKATASQLTERSRRIAYIAYREAILLAQVVDILPDDLVPPTGPEPTGAFDQAEGDSSPEPDTVVTETLSSSEAFQEMVELADAHDLLLESVSIQRDNLVYANAALQTETATLIDNLPPPKVTPIFSWIARLWKGMQKQRRM
ncbi:hypothetical protein OPQ81_002524 [Rhizoctonia solani]|nr:hypothetical protein OPQ81_002524 [Rhizoctonia solani]